MIKEPMSPATWRRIAECDECGRGPTREEFEDGYPEHLAEVRQHNEWHETADPEDVALHEEKERLDRELLSVFERRLLDELRPATMTRGFIGRRADSGVR